jgi:hypothetical protein
MLSVKNFLFDVFKKVNPRGMHSKWRPEISAPSQGFLKEPVAAIFFG